MDRDDETADPEARAAEAERVERALTRDDPRGGPEGGAGERDDLETAAGAPLEGLVRSHRRARRGRGSEGPVEAEVEAGREAEREVEEGGG